MGPSDAALIARVLADDDRHAFGELVRRHQSQLRALLRKLTCGDAGIADDLAQESLIRAYRGLRHYRGSAKFSTWLCQIALNAYRTHAARMKARAEVPVEHSTDATAASFDARSASRAPMPALRHDLERALDVLNVEEREALALAFGQDLTHEEAAAVLGCPLGTLKSRIKRALEKLEPRMAAWRDGVT